METIPKADCQKIGYIHKTHGVQGELALEYDPEFDEAITEVQYLLLEIDGLLVPFFIAEDGLRFKSANTALIQFDWITSEEQSRKLVGCSVYIHQETSVFDENDYSESQMIGYILHDEDNTEVGSITSIDNYSGNIVFTLQSAEQEVLIPFHEELLIELDHNKKIIKMRLPEGLLD